MKSVCSWTVFRLRTVVGLVAKLIRLAFWLKLTFACNALTFSRSDEAFQINVTWCGWGLFDGVCCIGTRECILIFLLRGQFHIFTVCSNFFEKNFWCLCSFSNPLYRVAASNCYLSISDFAVRFPFFILVIGFVDFADWYRNAYFGPFLLAGGSVGNNICRIAVRCRQRVVEMQS